jgi:hypothetical protein
VNGVDLSPESDDFIASEVGELINLFEEAIENNVGVQCEP